MGWSAVEQVGFFDRVMVHVVKVARDRQTRIRGADADGESAPDRGNGIGPFGGEGLHRRDVVSHVGFEIVIVAVNRFKGTGHHGEVMDFLRDQLLAAFCLEKVSEIGRQPDLNDRDRFFLRCLQRFQNQRHRLFRLLGNTDIVRITTYLEDTRDFGRYNRAFQAGIGDAVLARTTVEARAVINTKIEMDAIVYLPLSVDKT